MNLIAPPKAGKSWLASDLAIALATGQPWLGVFPTTLGNVLIVDNELHPETSANRIPRVAEARGYEPADYESRIFVDNLRGRLKDIHAMGSYFLSIEPGHYQLIILDAFYRFLPRDTDENDNGAMANIYNLLDWVSERKAAALLRRAVERGFIHRWPPDGQRGVGYASIPPPEQSIAANELQVNRPSKRQAVLDFLAANPDLSNREVAKRCDVSHTFVRKLRGNDGDNVAS